jgi:CHAD domain-containing protein
LVRDAPGTQRDEVNEETQSVTSNKLQLSATETLVESASKAITFYCEAMRRQHDAVVAGEIEPVHQLRVSSRRIRAAIELFSGILYAEGLKTFRRDIPWIAGQAGIVRNCDVLEELFKERASKLDVTLREALGPVIEAIALERNSAHNQLVADLSNKRYTHLVQRLSSPSIKTARGRAKLAIAAPDLLAPMVRGIKKKGAKLADDAPPEVFHKLRVRIKRLRYALDMLSPLAGKHHRKTLARLEEMQEMLGAYNDTVVGIAWLHSFAASSGAPPATILAAGALIHSLGARARKLMRQGLKAWERFDRSEVLEDALRELRETADDLADAERKAARQARAAAAQAAQTPANVTVEPDSVPPATQIEQPAAEPVTASQPAETTDAAPKAESENPSPTDSRSTDPKDTEHAA